MILGHVCDLPLTKEDTARRWGLLLSDSYLCNRPLVFSSPFVSYISLGFEHFVQKDLMFEVTKMDRKKRLLSYLIGNSRKHTYWIKGQTNF